MLPTTSSSAGRTPPLREPAPVPANHALLISADPALQEWLARQLAPRGWQVQTIDSSGDLARLERTPPLALIAYDLALAGTHRTTIARLRHRVGETAIVLLIGAGEGDPAMLLESPVDDLLPRPTLSTAHERQALPRLRLAARAAEASLLREEIGELRSVAGVQQVFFERLVEQAPEGIVVSGEDERVIRANTAFCRIFGFRHHEVVGRSVDELIAPGALAEEALGVTLRVRAGETVALDCARCRKDGSRVRVSLLATPMRIGEEQQGTLAIYRDPGAYSGAEAPLLHRKQEPRGPVEPAPAMSSQDVSGQKALRRSEDLYRYLFEQNPQPMWVYDVETLRFLAVNQTTASKYGYSVDELLQRTIRDIRPAEDVPKLLENLATAGGEGFEHSGPWRHQARDGRILWVEVMSHGITFQDRPARLVLAHDVTQQRAAEQALRKSEQQFRALFDQAPLGVLHFDRDLRVVACNRQLAKALGYAAPQEMVGLDLTGIRDKRILPAFRRTLHGAPAYYEGPYRPMRRAARPWIALHLSPLYDEAGEVEGGIAVIQDITAQREASTRLAAQARELERVNQALQQRSVQVEEALLARNRLYAAMNHELRTPISAIMLYHDLLLGGSMGALNAAQKDSVENAQRAAQHLLELVQDVLDLSRLEAGSVSVSPEPISVAELVHEVMETLRPLADRRGSIFDVRGLEPHLTLVTDARRLRQIMLNLLSNAVKFGGGRPISVASHALAERWIALDVVDRGRGIAPEDLERIFDEFVQVGNHQEGGSGLGLAISRRLTELLGGTLTVESEPGSGSIFRLVLPPTAPVSPPAERAGTSTAPA